MLILASRELLLLLLLGMGRRRNQSQADTREIGLPSLAGFPGLLFLASGFVFWLLFPPGPSSSPPPHFVSPKCGSKETNQPLSLSPHRKQKEPPAPLERRRRGVPGLLLPEVEASPEKWNSSGKGGERLSRRVPP